VSVHKAEAAPIFDPLYFGLLSEQPESNRHPLIGSQT